MSNLESLRFTQIVEQLRSGAVSIAEAMPILLHRMIAESDEDELRAMLEETAEAIVPSSDTLSEVR
jgi:hypothetical protein